MNAKELTAAEQKDIEGQTYTRIPLGPRLVSFGGGYSFVLVMEEQEGVFERVGNTYLSVWKASEFLAVH
jgi:hypothetical protein